MAALLALGACSTVSSISDTFFGGGSVGAARVNGFLGGVVADEPTAALAGREVLALGGTAADAAVAVGFTLAVTYPSRASLGSGGACLAYSPARTGAGGGAPEAILFTPIAPAAPSTGAPSTGAPSTGAASSGASSPAASGTRASSTGSSSRGAASTGPSGRSDRPAAVPMLPRGLFALHARYGRRPFETLVAPAEKLARFGARASRAFVRDLALVSGPLLADPNARDVFAPGGVTLTEGAALTQAELGGTLTQIRTAGVGDLYQGALAQRFVGGAAVAGGGLTLADMRAALPKTLTPIIRPAGDDSVAFLPIPADGGLAAAAAFRALQLTPGDLAAANSRGLAVAAAWRAGGDPAALLANTPASAPSAPLPALPASTSFATLDRDGNAVVCALTMDNLFGTGRIAPGTGVVLAASPASVPPPLLAAAIAWNANLRAFRAAVGGTGQEAAPLAVAATLYGVLHNAPVPPPDPGRADVIACSQYLPGNEASCRWAGDKRDAGLAVGSN